MSPIEQEIFQAIQILVNTYMQLANSDISQKEFNRRIKAVNELLKLSVKWGIYDKQTNPIPDSKSEILPDIEKLEWYLMGGECQHFDQDDRQLLIDILKKIEEKLHVN